MLSGAVCQGRKKALPWTDLSVSENEWKYKCKYAEIRFPGEQGVNQVQVAFKTCHQSPEGSSIVSLAL